MCFWSVACRRSAGHRLPLATPMSVRCSSGPERTTKLGLTDYRVSAWRSTWQRRAAQVDADPLSAVWITRLVLAPSRGLVVGRAGFDEPPDEGGRIEIGYAIDPTFRQQGYARSCHRAAESN